MNFVETYVESLRPLECPVSYLTFSCLAMVSTLVGKKVWCKRGSIQTYPNILVCLIGDAGSGKTTAMSHGRKVLRSIKGVNLAKKCPSTQKLMECMQEGHQEFIWKGEKLVHTPMGIWLSELSNFVQLSPEFMVPFLNDAYDDDIFDYETLSRGVCILNQPVLSGVVCCTHSWIGRQQELINFEDGVGRRFIWLLDSCEKRNRTPAAEIPGMIYEKCQIIKGLIGEFQWSPEADDWHKKWYEDYDRHGKNNTRFYHANKHVHLEKVAMLLALANRQELVFRVEDFEEALEVLALMEKNLHRVFENVGRNQLSPVANRIIHTLQANGSGISTEGMLRAATYSMVTSREFEEIISHLYKSRIIDKVGEGSASTIKLLPVEDGTNGKEHL